MNLDCDKKTTIAVAGLLAALLVTGLIMSRQHPADKSEQPTGANEESTPAKSPTTSEESTSLASSEKQLIQTYGEHRVRQSRRIATKILTLNQHIAETGSENNARLHIAQLLERDPSTLNPSDFDLPETDSPLPSPSTEELTSLSKNPLPLQETVLAADARSRGILTEAQFQSILAIAAKHVPAHMLGTGSNSLSLEDAEKNIEKLTRAIE